ncbi:hypothetical protein LZ32DRAFT_223901 [Colletotrichum eremochloae]|nr:hypothetical protein LZ32DRAFT_223901 [Colletotrichum eremochloae]
MACCREEKKKKGKKKKSAEKLILATGLRFCFLPFFFSLFFFLSGFRGQSLVWPSSDPHPLRRYRLAG